MTAGIAPERRWESEYGVVTTDWTDNSSGRMSTNCHLDNSVKEKSFLPIDRPTTQGRKGPTVGMGLMIGLDGSQ